MTVLADVTMEQQRSPQWCWAAITSSLSAHIQGQTISQEDVVCRILANQNCRLQPTPDICNVPFPLENAIRRICLRMVGIRGQVPFTMIQSQIDQRRQPLPITLAFPTQFGPVSHYVLIKGCTATPTSQEVILLDPAHTDAGESHVPFINLVQGTSMQASWMQTFLIQ